MVMMVVMVVMVMRAYGNNGDGRPFQVDDNKHYDSDFGVHDNDGVCDLE